MAAVSEQVRQVVAAQAQAHHLDLEDLTLVHQGRRAVLEVVVDRDGGIDLDGVAEFSSRLSQALDAIDRELPDAYVLEVGSPGIDRPLTLERHWRRAADRLVEVHPTQGPAFTDRVAKVSDGIVTFEGHAPMPITELHQGFVQVEFTRGGDDHGH